MEEHPPKIRGQSDSISSMAFSKVKPPPEVSTLVLFGQSVNLIFR